MKFSFAGWTLVLRFFSTVTKYMEHSTVIETESHLALQQGSLSHLQQFATGPYLPSEPMDLVHVLTHNFSDIILFI